MDTRKSTQTPTRESNPGPLTVMHISIVTLNLNAGSLSSGTTGQSCVHYDITASTVCKRNGRLDHFVCVFLLLAFNTREIQFNDVVIFLSDET